jgi:hypothetical protein
MWALTPNHIFPSDLGLWGWQSEECDAYLRDRVVTQHTARVSSSVLLGFSALTDRSVDRDYVVNGMDREWIGCENSVKKELEWLLQLVKLRMQIRGGGYGNNT